MNSAVLDPVEKLDLARQRDLQERLLPTQIDLVRAGSPFFAALLEDEPVRSLDELATLPFVRKQELRNAQADDPPLGSIGGVALERVSRLHITSGTTGMPLLIGFTAADLERSTRVGARAFWAAGVRPRHVILHCLNYAFYVGGIADHMSVEATGATVVPVGIGQSDRVLDLFALLRPSAMFAITSYSHHLAEKAADRGLDPAALGLDLVVTGGEPGGDVHDVRARIERTWGCRVADTYGLGEVWPTFAGHCELRDGLHATAPDLLVIELLDMETERPLDWRTGATGELVYTHLEREASPLVRYRSGDIATVLDTACACGRGTPRFRLVGRVDDMFIVRGVNVFPSAVEAVLAEAVPGLRGFAIVLDRAAPEPPVPLVVEADNGVSAEDVGRIVRERLQVQVRVHSVPRGTLEVGQQKTKRIWRTYAGDKPDWLSRLVHSE
jgi:phenylacetate-CoA ligase